VVASRDGPPATVRQIAHREERRSAPGTPVCSKLSGEFTPTLFGPLLRSVVPKRALHGPARYRVDTDGDADLKDSGAALP